MHEIISGGIDDGPTVIVIMRKLSEGDRIDPDGGRIIVGADIIGGGYLAIMV